MIKSIRLTSFGRFENSIFDFSLVTVFVGDNESGKTTVFDALFEGICRPKGSTVHGRRLTARYGPEREFQIHYDDAGPILMDPEPFLNLNAVGAGAVPVSFTGGGSWIERLKASLFTGGIHPGKLAEEFDVLAKEKGMLTHVLKHRKKREERDRTKKRIEELNKRKAIILGKESELDRLRNELEGLSSRRNELENQKAGKERMLEQQAKIREREGLIKTLAVISEVLGIEEQLRRMAAFEEDQADKLKKLSSELGRLKAENTALDGEEKRTRERLRAAISLVERKTKEAASLETAAGTADRLVRRIELEMPRAVIRKVSVWNRLLLTLSLLPVAAAAAALAFFRETLHPFLVTGVSALVFLVIVLSARKTAETTINPDTSEFVARLQEDWRIHCGGSELKSSTAEGITSELLAFRSERDSVARELSRLQKDRDELAAGLADISSHKSGLESETAAAKSRLDETLLSFGVKSVEEYIRHRSDYEHIKGELRRKRSELEPEMNRFNVSSLKMLKVECETRAAELAGQISAQKESEAAMNLLREELSAVHKELAALASSEASVRSRLDKGEGEVKGSLGELPVEIYEAEKTLQRCENELLAMEIDRKAAALARDIFVDMSQDSESIFLDLSADIARFLDGMIPGGRDVNLTGLKSDNIKVTDAGGSLRLLEHLSTGTRDAFHLAARLALTRRMHQKDTPALILLDEPFHSLDTSRSLTALHVLLKFHQEHRWQVVLFTKEKNIAGQMEEMFPHVKIHRLSAGNDL